MSDVVACIPPEVRRSLRWARDILRSLLASGNARQCPVCGRPSRRFFRAGRVPREEALCGHCGALDRHRLVWVFFLRKTNLFDGLRKRMLHVAPDKCIQRNLRMRLGDGYVTADLEDPRVMVTMDIACMPYSDESFDVIYCSHVLEHVRDDRRALKEFHRVLKKDGWAVLLVPITAERTREDPAVEDPVERRRLFGQEDHFRRYGPDYVERLHEAGFRVSVTGVADLCTAGEAGLFGLTANSGEIYYCTKG